MDPLTRLLATYPEFAAMPAAVHTALAQAQPLSLAAGTRVFDEGSACAGFPLVLSGAIRVLKAAPNGRELPLYRVEPGETCVVTSGCLLGAQPYRARGLTEAPTELRLLPAPAFDALLGEPAFRRFVFAIVSERIAELMQRIEEVAFQRLDQRLAARLLGRGRVLHLTHQQLADELGSVREMVSRLLKGFAEHGWVALGREQIEILDPQALRALAGAPPD